MKKLKLLTLKGIVSFFGIGFLKIAPGTCGSLATVVLWLVIIQRFKNNLMGFFPFVLILTFIIFVIGLISSYYYMKEINNNDDPQEIVIDEVAGQLLSFISSFAFLPFVKNINSITILQNKSFLIFFYIFTPFILFRLFDITKPLLAGYFDRKKNALGVMMDDVFAGIYAGLTNALLIFLIIKFLY